MSHWNYRVTRQQIGDDWFEYEIREVYHIDDKVGWTDRAMGPFGESVDELQYDLTKMQGAFDRPVLDVTDEDNPHEVKESDHG